MLYSLQSVSVLRSILKSSPLHNHAAESRCVAEVHWAALQEGSSASDKQLLGSYSGETDNQNDKGHKVWPNFQSWGDLLYILNQGVFMRLSNQMLPHILTAWGVRACRQDEMISKRYTAQSTRQENFSQTDSNSLSFPHLLCGTTVMVWLHHPCSSNRNICPCLAFESQS